MKDLYTNRSSRRDFAVNAFNQFDDQIREIYIATAFFTDTQPIEQLLNKDCRIRLVVRLGFPTNPDALKKILNKPGVEIRFYSDTSFHPKLYIFGDKYALVGSANLTHSALKSNQEILVSINASDDRFTELASLFSEYWDGAKVLTEEELKEYFALWQKYSQNISAISRFDEDIKNNKNIGEVIFENIQRGKAKKSKESIFIDSYNKAYQESVSAFNEIKKEYLSIGYRKVPDEKVPVRLEIDSFFSFVRENHAQKDHWLKRPVGWNETSRELLRNQIKEWMHTQHVHLEMTIANVNYPLIMSVFGSEGTIENASMENIVSGLCVLHSFHDSLRFHDGGLDALMRNFTENNDEKRVKESLKYLLYGDRSVVARMCDLIYNSEYKLSFFGVANVQELIGWINKEELPVINGRTTKVLRYYGFEVKQL